MDVKSQLVLASARMARSAPESWNQFLGAFQLYADQMVDACIKSPLEELQVRQGRAQSTAYLLDVLKDCLTDADKLEGKINAQRTTR